MSDTKYIDGYVTDANGNPVAGATVNAVITGAVIPSAGTYSGQDGSFVIELPEPGTYTITAFKRGDSQLYLKTTGTAAAETSSDTLSGGMQFTAVQTSY